MTLRTAKSDQHFSKLRYDERMKEFLETQQQLREARAFDVSAILAEYPDAKKFWIDQFGADRQAVQTSQFIEVSLAAPLYPSTDAVCKGSLRLEAQA